MKEEAHRFSTTSLQRLQQHSLFRFQIQDAEVGASVAELQDILVSGRDLPDHFEILTELVHGIEDQIQDSDTRELYLLASLQHFTQEMEVLLEMDNEAELNPDDMPSFAAIFARESGDKQRSVNIKASNSSAGSTAKKAIVTAAPDAEDDVACSVCFEGDSTEGDAIVICELCNTAVHQTCYRIEYLPEDDWYCHPCSRYLKEQDIEKNVTPPHELECVACMMKGGAMVPTVEGKWMHMSCSMFLPELYVRRVGTQGEVICGVEKLTARRKLRCCFCKK
uniref:PHD-type domain-containing protein n=1 Tax=Globisporangium ultimum (strain ATCC 200006 / CBS 805.95 / DAOM BR144) TaxID=431595 RepID=K3X7U1_GLOUD